MAIGRLKTLFIILSSKFVILLDFEPDYAIYELWIGFIDQNFKDGLTVKGAFMHLYFIKLKVI